MRQLVSVMAFSLSAEQLQTLRDCHLFHNVDVQWLLSALNDPRCFIQFYQKSALICGGQSFERRLGILLSGRIRVSRTNHDGKHMPVSLQTAGAMFGMAVLFCDASVFPTELHSEDRCEILYIKESLLLELMQHKFEIAENYIRYLSGRILFLNNKIAGLSAGDSTHKLAQWLSTHNSTSIALPPISRLAQELNIGRASLYRALETLEQANTIRRDGKNIILLDLAQLQTLHHLQPMD